MTENKTLADFWSYFEIPLKRKKIQAALEISQKYENMEEECFIFSYNVGALTHTQINFRDNNLSVIELYPPPPNQHFLACKGFHR